MGSTKMSINIIVLLNIIYCACIQGLASFTQERRLDHVLTPAMVNGQRLYTYYHNNTTVVTSPDPGYKECNISSIIPPNYRHELGNGKMVAFTMIYTHFSIFDFKNCSTYSVVHIDNGKTYKHSEEKEINAVIPYYDTFDVFSLYWSHCLPCRYNDKGERLQVDNKIKSEWDTPKNYFVGLMKNVSDVGDGYLYALSFRNDSTTLKLLDSKYNVVKERSLAGQYKACSLTYDRITVCTTVNICPERWFGCYSLRCHLFDSNLHAITSVIMHQPDNEQYLFVSVEINNLENDGAMVSTVFTYYETLRGNSDHEAFIQQIHPNGKLEPEIHFGNFHAKYVFISDFISNTGEYCLMASIDEKKHEGYSLIKCVIPKVIKND